MPYNPTSWQRPYSEARATEEKREGRGWGDAVRPHGTTTEQEKSAFTRWVEAILSSQHQAAQGMMKRVMCFPAELYLNKTSRYQREFLHVWIT